MASGIPGWLSHDDPLSGTEALDRAEARIKPRLEDPLTRGKCRACGELVAYADAPDHAAAHWGGDDGGAYVLRIDSRERHDYWMIARAARGAFLSDIDGRLRRSWLDCHFDHISMMVVDGIDFNGGVVLGEHEPGDMYLRMEDHTVEEVLGSGSVGDYTYDLMPHRTTYLDVRVVDACSAAGMGRPVEVAMRNEKIEHDCDECGRRRGGRRICIECSSLGEDRLMCDACARGHRHDGDLRFLPVRNSPRMGRCMYGRSDRRDTTPWPPSHAWGKRYGTMYPNRFI